MKIFIAACLFFLCAPSITAQTKNADLLKLKTTLDNYSVKANGQLNYTITADAMPTVINFSITDNGKGMIFMDARPLDDAQLGRAVRYINNTKMLLQDLRNSMMVDIVNPFEFQYYEDYDKKEMLQFLEIILFTVFELKESAVISIVPVENSLKK